MAEQKVNQLKNNIISDISFKQEQQVEFNLPPPQFFNNPFEDQFNPGDDFFSMEILEQLKDISESKGYIITNNNNNSKSTTTMNNNNNNNLTEDLFADYFQELIHNDNNLQVPNQTKIPVQQQHHIVLNQQPFPNSQMSHNIQYPNYPKNPFSVLAFQQSPISPNLFQNSPSPSISNNTNQSTKIQSPGIQSSNSSVSSPNHPTNIPPNVIPTAGPQVYSNQVNQLNQGYSFAPNFYGSLNSQTANLIRICEGFNKKVKDKVIGGKDNTRHAIPQQVIELAINKLPPNSDPSVLSVRASVLGYDRVSRNRVVLTHLHDKPFIRTGTPPTERWISVFDDIIIQFASHNNGQKLAVRFELLDADKKPVCHVDSFEFETITKRGLEKIKARKQKRKRNGGGDEEEDEDSDPYVHSVTPGVGPVTGGQLVKILGTGFVCTPLTKAVVRFGEREAREIHAIKRNSIVCETPEGEIGVVDVNVSLEEGKFLQSNAKFQYINPNDPKQMQLVIEQMFGKPVDKSSNSSSGSSTNSFGQANLFANGKSKDECGFNVLHHSCAHGYFDLSKVLITAGICELEDVDNYGRTALHWSAFASSSITTVYLLSKGANLLAKDDINDNFLHIACRYSSVEYVKDVFVWLLKYDDKQKTNTVNIINLLNGRNDDGLTPIDLLRTMSSEEEVEEMTALLQAFNEVCESRLSDYRIQELKDIILRAGEYNGKRMTELENQLGFNCQLNKDQFVICLDKTDRILRATIDYKQIAFLILCRSQNRAEITLNSKPQIDFKMKGTDTWTPVSGDKYLSSCLSFHLEVVDISALDKINSFILENDLLYQFQEFCFCFRPSVEQIKQTNTESKQIGDLTEKTKTLSLDDKSNNNNNKFSERKRITFGHKVEQSTEANTNHLSV